MKKLAVVSLSLLMVFSAFAMGNATQSLFAAEATGEGVIATPQEEQRIVTVSGTGEVTVKPDVAYISIGVETRDEDASVAQDENKAIMNKIITALEKVGIDVEEDLKTSNYSISRQYDYYDEGKTEYYLVSNILEVTVRDLDSVGEVIDAAANAGANKIHNISFAVEDKTAYYNDALKLAMKDAQGKANAILSTIGKKVGLPIKINEDYYYDYGYAANIRLEAVPTSADFTTPIEAGDLTIRATVSVQYDY